MRQLSGTVFTQNTQKVIESMRQECGMIDVGEPSLWHCLRWERWQETLNVEHYGQTKSKIHLFLSFPVSSAHVQ